MTISQQKEWTHKDTLICNLRHALRDADQNSDSIHCLGCGHERDEEHKTDCLIYPKVNSNDSA